MRLTKVDRVIGFPQKSWMELYISLNEGMPVAAKNDKEKDFHKLITNAVYGKTWENQRTRMHIHLENDRLKAGKLVDKAL